MFLGEIRGWAHVVLVCLMLLNTSSHTCWGMHLLLRLSRARPAVHHIRLRIRSPWRELIWLQLSFRNRMLRNRHCVCFVFEMLRHLLGLSCPFSNTRHLFLTKTCQLTVDRIILRYGD